MADATEALTKEVGAGKLKLPLYMWAIAAVAGVWIARNARGYFNSGGATSDADAETAEPLGSFATVGAGGAVFVPGGSFDSGASVALEDNDAWRKAAVTYLTRQSFNAFEAATAIDRYLTGDQLNTSQTLMVETALRQLGPTPEPVPAPIGNQTPVKVPVGPFITAGEYAGLSFNHKALFKPYTTGNGAAGYVLVDLSKTNFITTAEWGNFSAAHKSQWRAYVTTNGARGYVPA